MDSRKMGLTNAEVQASLDRYGSNRIQERQVEGFWEKFRHNFHDPIIRILCAALGINIVFTVLGEAPWYESLGIALAVLIATLVSTLSEYRNENAFQALQKEAAQILCKTWRDGELAEIDIDALVTGDCVLLQMGDKVPADGIIIEGEIHVDQSVLNGEAQEAVKERAPEQYEDEGRIDFLTPYQVFRGSVVCSGNAVMQVTKVGEKSVYGGLASELQVDVERDTPLKLKLNHLAQQISRFGYLGGIAIALAYLFQRIVIHNGFDMARIIAYSSDWMAVMSQVIEAIMLAVTIIVMAVPEGLPLMIAIVSAQNMGRMLDDNVLVRKLAGIETAGSLNILFSDKTGTITKGQLAAVCFVSGSGRKTAGFTKLPAALRRLAGLSICGNTEAMFSEEGGRRHAVGGNMTDRALLGYVQASSENRLSDIRKLAAVPFDSREKYSAAYVEAAGQKLSLIKGAPEKILARCTAYYGEDGLRHAWTDEGRMVKQQMKLLASRAIRVLALAASEEALQTEAALQKNDWTFIGLVGIRDEVREDAAEAIREVHRAGVQVVMITGDRKDTAAAIAREAGILDVQDAVMLTSDELSSYSDADLRELLPRLRVVSRALPSDKSRLVGLAQAQDLVVGMTGDGVNDATALKRADVGFAMGGGTEVAKEASEIVILDDNFKSIEKSILYGRTIFNNIRKFIIFQLTVNVAAVLISFVAPLLGFDPPLTITQILWVNLVMDTLAALAFGGEPTLRRYMRERPKRRNEAIVSPYMWLTILVDAIWTFLLSLVFLLTGFAAAHFRIGFNDPMIYRLTGYFDFFIFIAIGNAFNARTMSLDLLDNIQRNPGFLKVMGIIAAVQIGMTYGGGEVMHCHGLDLQEWIFVVLLAVTVVPVDLLKKIIYRSFTGLLHK
jgi:calcium-translocating P-type ATPase